VAANAVAGPIGEIVALPLSLAHCLASAWPAAERGMAAVAGGALLAVRAIAHATAASPWATASLPPPSVTQLAVLAVAGFGRGRFAGVGDPSGSRCWRSWRSRHITDARREESYGSRRSTWVRATRSWSICPTGGS